MLIERNENDYKTEVTNITCEYHKKNPLDRNYPGCTCSTSITSVRKTEEEKQQEKEVDWDKLREEIFIKYHDLFVKLAKL